MRIVLKPSHGDIAYGGNLDVEYYDDDGNDVSKEFKHFVTGMQINVNKDDIASVDMTMRSGGFDISGLAIRRMERDRRWRDALSRWFYRMGRRFKR